MSDIIRMAREQYGSQYDQMAANAGQVKAEYVEQGGDPADVYSIERLHELARGGGQALEQLAPEQRPDGSIAGPFVPTEMAIAEGLIEDGALPSVLAALMEGIDTVSSGVDQGGCGFAVGKGPDGQVVKVQA
jgi:hypothetical protein